MGLVYCHFHTGIRASGVVGRRCACVMDQSSFFPQSRALPRDAALLVHIVGYFSLCIHMYCVVHEHDGLRSNMRLRARPPTSSRPRPIPPSHRGLSRAEDWAPHCRVLCQIPTDVLPTALVTGPPGLRPQLDSNTKTDQAGQAPRLSPP